MRKWQYVRMSSLLFLALLIVAEAAILRAVAQDNFSTRITTCYPYNQDKHLDVGVDVVVPNWRGMTNLEPVYATARSAAENQCKTAKAPSAAIMKLSVEVKNTTGMTVLRAEMSLWQPQTREMRVTWDNRAAVARAEDEHRTRAAAAQAASEMNEKRRQIAVTDCGSGPKFSGGPWFSSTYGVAANDEVQRAKEAGYFCIKDVEYLSAAPNPFGGKAARAKFTGYKKDRFELLVQVRDFAY